MPDLSEIISAKVFSIALITAFLVLLLFVKRGVIRSWFDPALLPFFQVTFTFATLVTIGTLPIDQTIYFILFILLIVASNRIHVKRLNLLPASLFEGFSYVLFIICILTNAYIISRKGFIFLVNDVSDAKLFYYQDFGIFKRINEIAVPIISITAFKFWRSGEKLKSIAYFTLSAFCLITLGSKSGLITFLFLYGSYFHFNKEQEKTIINRNKLAFLGVGLFLFLSSFLMFYIIFQQYFMEAFFFRFIAYADGPVFFYDQQLYKHISYNPMYMFDQFAYAIRIRSQLKYISIGPLINYYTFDVDSDLFGPNPQIFVESGVMFHSFAAIYYLFTFLVFFFCRKLSSTPYSFYFLTLFSTTLFIDSQYAFYHIFNMLILGVMLAIYIIMRLLLTKKRVLPVT